MLVKAEYLERDEEPDNTMHAYFRELVERVLAVSTYSLKKRNTALTTLGRETATYVREHWWIRSTTF